MKIEIGDIERIRLEPGDQIAVKVPYKLNMDTAHQLKERVGSVLGIDPDRVLVLDGGISLTAVTP